MLPRRPALAALGLLACLGLAACVAPLTEAELETSVSSAARQIRGLSAARVMPIHAETKLIAMALLAEARADPRSELSLQMSRRIALAAGRRQSVATGGSYPELVDQVLANALLLNPGRSLAGMRILVVTPASPGPVLSKAARERGVQIVHRALR